MSAAAGTGRAVVCLLDDWDLLRRDPHRQAVFRRNVTLAGGYTVPQLGEGDRPARCDR